MEQLQHLKKENTRPRARKVGKIVGRFFILFGIFLGVLLLFFYGLLWVLCKGPSESARDLFVTTCMETSFARYFPPLVLSGDEIAEIQRVNAPLPLDEVTDPSADFSDPSANGGQDSEQPDIEVIEIIGATYKGKLMIVKDPSRLVVGTPPAFGKDAEGMLLSKMLENAGAVAGINAGGFVDTGGVGNGGTPLGIVIKDGKLAYGNPGMETVVIGFDKKNVLHVGSMTAQEALDKGMRDAVSFEPVLVVNGKPAEFSGTGGGLNPRTAIGQREDGSVLLLVIDGRQPHSLGATYKDLVDVMLEYGAVNAGNLDGGSSSMLYYNGELINTCASLYGPRKIPTSFLVLPSEE